MKIQRTPRRLARDLQGKGKDGLRESMMERADLAIGVFDSGMGGLTVLRALRATLPQESFIYLGDTARLPYGTKSPDTVQHYAVQMARVLVERRIKALVIACNTATTAALPHLQQMLPDIPVIGVVAPGAAAATRVTRNAQILVLATETTIASRAYHARILEHLPEARVAGRACSVLVALAEDGMTGNAVAREALLHYLDGYNGEDTVLLGCTHFPVFRDLLAELLPKGVHLVDSAEATAEALQQSLHAQALLSHRQGRGSVHYLVTDSIQRFQHVGEIFLGEPLDAARIEFVDACQPVV